MFEDVNLITPKESIELFQYQKELIDSYANKPLADTLVRLALLQTLTPINDTKEAINILRKHGISFDDFSLLVIGSYLMSTWSFGQKNVFLEKILEFEGLSDNELSIVKLLAAYDMIYQNNNNINAAMCLLEESIKLCPRNPRAFLLLGYITKEQKYVVLAKKSVDVILCDGKIKKLCISDLVDPEFFINEHVKGLYMSEFTYNAL